MRKTHARSRDRRKPPEPKRKSTTRGYKRLARDDGPGRKPNKTKAVEQAIEAFIFLGGISLGETPAIAKNRCHELSMAFAWYCKGLGEVCEIIRCVGAKKKISLHVERAGDEKIVSHYVVWFPDEEKAVDWTARQFWPEAPHPWVLSKVGLEHVWNEIEWPSTTTDD
jgi:hypothetical protein